MKEILFISYASENNDKVELIINELKDHQIFEPLVVAKKREPNKALVKKVTEGIDIAYRFIPILTSQSIKTQWIKQETGYASGKNVPIVPIVEKYILNDLKGFVHKQNDCPYTYTASIRLLHRGEENKSFMTCFRLLIKDLEEEYKANQKKSKQEIIREASRSLLPPSQQYSLSGLRNPLGTIARTGEECPETGIWKTNKQPTTSIPFAVGTRMPPYEGKPMIWKLVSYT
jgi:hypothetical protein